MGDIYTPTKDRAHEYLQLLLRGERVEHPMCNFSWRHRAESEHFEVAEILARASGQLSGPLEEIKSPQLDALWSAMVANSYMSIDRFIEGK